MIHKTSFKEEKQKLCITLDLSDPITSNRIFSISPAYIFQSHFKTLSLIAPLHVHWLLCFSSKPNCVCSWFYGHRSFTAHCSSHTSKRSASVFDPQYVTLKTFKSLSKTRFKWSAFLILSLNSEMQYKLWLFSTYIGAFKLTFFSISWCPKKGQLDSLKAVINFEILFHCFFTLFFLFTTFCLVCFAS